MINTYQIGNAQTIGRREVQSNYFSTRQNNAGDLLAVLADGTIDHANGRTAAVMAVEYCVEVFLRNIFHKYTEETLLETALQANRYVQDTVYMDKSPRLSLSMVLFTYEEILYFSVGSNKIFLYDGYSERPLGGDGNSPYVNGQFPLPKKCVIGILSAGAHSITHPMERIKIVESEIETFDKAQAFIELTKGKRQDNQANATVLLIDVRK